MLVTNPNSVKIYNLSAGKSLPEWLSDRRKRALQKQDVDIRRRIELIQDFEMPTVSNCIKATRDNKYVFATGVYKPRVRCYDVSQLSMKFERCFDAEVVDFYILSEDYSKLVFMQSDRYIEFHAQYGKYYRTRIPRNGREMDYHSPTCDMYFVGASPEIYRLNLELGRFVTSLKTESPQINCCQFNPVHNLFACGGSDGYVECWDPRSRTRAGRLLCLSDELESTEKLGAVTSLRFRDGLTMAAGTQSGHILLYDIRSGKPVLTKDHQYGLPIKSIAFHDTPDVVMSMDKRVMKMWHRDSGKAFTAIEAEHDLNDLCVLPNSGMFFMANEAPKILSYYVPALGPAPKWCSFLDSITEELEETDTSSVYDDYKFVTRTELDTLGLTHLIGSSLLRAYMHGYFMDIRLYHKAKSIAEPFAYKEYKQSKIREKIEQERSNRVKLQKLPKVNRQLAEKLMDQTEDPQAKKKKKVAAETLLEDNRFSALFRNPDFQIDTESEEYRLLNPIVSKVEKQRKKKLEKAAAREQFAQVEEDQEAEGRPSSEEESSDDDNDWVQEVKEQHRLLQQQKRNRKRETEAAPAFYEVKTQAGPGGAGAPSVSVGGKRKLGKMSLGDRVAHQDKEGQGTLTSGSARGSMEMTFQWKKNKRREQQQEENRHHHQERKKLRRSAGEIMKDRKLPPKFWMGKRVQ